MVSFTATAREILNRPPRLGPVRLVAVDGPSGSGKTTFVVRLGGALRDAGATVGTVATDDLLDGWTDTVTFWPRLAAQVLDPLRRGEPGAYRRYDWDAGRFGDRIVPVPVPDVLILEGVTSARAVMESALTTSFYLAVPAELRHRRGLERDAVALGGRDLDSLRRHLTRWWAAEDVHFAADRTWKRAEFVVDGAPGVRHDPGDAFIRLDPGEIDDDHI